MLPRPEKSDLHAEYLLRLTLMCLTHPTNMCFIDAKQQLAL
eukprot:COSAG02_NODE_62809_length_265_cov_0.530120_1_plen_40_part_10